MEEIRDSELLELTNIQVPTTKRIITSIPIKKSTHSRLREYGKKSETWDEVLNRLLDTIERITGD